MLPNLDKLKLGAPTGVISHPSQTAPMLSPSPRRRIFLRGKPCNESEMEAVLTESSKTKRVAVQEIYQKILAAMKVGISDIGYMTDSIALPEHVCPRSENSKCIQLTHLSVSSDITEPIRLLWSGWEADTQWLACNIAERLHKSGINAFALEQTHYSHYLLHELGSWHQQLDKLKAMFVEKLQLARPLDDEEELMIEKLRKRLWDSVSEMWAKDKRFGHTLAIIPSKNYNTSSTLGTIELPNLPDSSKVCFLVYDCYQQQVQYNMAGEFFPVSNGVNLSSELFEVKSKALALYRERLGSLLRR